MSVWRDPNEAPYNVKLLVVRNIGEMVIAERLSYCWLGPMGTVFKDVAAWMPLPEYNREAKG